MLNLERIDRIREEIQQKKAVTVQRLSEKYFVSPSTIRRDLDILEKEGLIRRTYGGAVLVIHPSNEIPYSIRCNENTAAKDVIGELAADLVAENQFIALDTTSTVAFMLPHLRDKVNLKILTNSAQIAIETIESLPSARVFCTGGWMNKLSRGFEGETTRLRIAEYHTDVLFFSARCVSMDAGITDVNEEDVYLKQQMMKNSRKVVFLCDHSKFDHTSYRSVCPVERIDYLVTDKRPSHAWLAHLEASGVEVIFPE
jgi:DeoR/GlpR family transcriptional regulator of sugar metabolism